MRSLGLFFSLAVFLALHTAVAAEAISGRLLDENGKPLPAVTVCLCARWLDVYNAELPYTNYTPQQVAAWHQGESDIWLTSTDAQGQFSFPPTQKNYSLFAATDNGYVIAKAKDLTFPTTLQLTRWAKIHGVVKRGDKAAGAGIPVSVEYDAPDSLQDEIGPYLHFIGIHTDDGQIHTNEQGEFFVNRAFAGNYGFCRMIPRTQMVNGKTQTMLLGSGVGAKMKVLPGTTAEVTVPIIGRPVVGRIELPEALRARNDFAINTDNSGELKSELRLPSISLPANALQMSAQQQQSWFNAWKQTAEGQRAMKQEELAHQRRSVHFSVDHSFQLLDMEPGVYTLRCIFMPKKNNVLDYEHILGGASYQFTVGTSPDSASDLPLDVGTLAPQAEGIANCGQPAPDFIFQSLDGARHTLGEFKGKVILLDFWGTWCGSCIKQIPHLKEIHDTFSGNPNFVMISLSTHDTPEQLRKFVTQHQMTWPQAILGDDPNAPPLLFYQVTGFPTYWLIDRNGKTAYNDWLSDDLKAAVAKALEK